MSKLLRLSLLLGLISLVVAGGCSLGDRLGPGSGAPLDPALQDTPDGEFVTKAVDFGKGVSTTYEPYVDESPDWTWEFISSQHELAGTLTATNDATTLYIEYQLDGWVMDEAMVLVSTSVPDPKAGKPGQFPYKHEFEVPCDNCVFEVPLADLSGKGTLYIAAYAQTMSDDGLWAGYWNDGKPSWDFNWKKWGGGFATGVMPVPALPNTDGEMVSYKGYHWGYTSYWDVLFNEPLALPPGGFSHPYSTRPPGTYYVGWCTDQGHTIRSGWDYTVQIFSTYDPQKPDWAQSGNWDMVNYMINQRRAGAYDGFGPFTGTSADARNNKNLFQNAVWFFVGVVASPPPGSAIVGVPDYNPTGVDLYNTLVRDALENGDNYIPGPGDYYALVLFDCDAALSNSEQGFQMNIIEVDP